MEATPASEAKQLAVRAETFQYEDYAVLKEFAWIASSGDGGSPPILSAMGSPAQSVAESRSFIGKSFDVDFGDNMNGRSSVTSC